MTLPSDFGADFHVCPSHEWSIIVPSALAEARMVSLGLKARLLTSFLWWALSVSGSLALTMVISPLKSPTASTLPSWLNAMLDICVIGKDS